MNKYLKKDLNDLRTEKIVDKYIGNSEFIYNYYMSVSHIHSYILHGKYEKQTLLFLDKFCSAIHNALLRRAYNAPAIRDFIINNCLIDTHLSDNNMRRRYCKVIMIILKYRTFFIYFLNLLNAYNNERNLPYLDKKKLFSMNGKILLKTSRRILKRHLLVLDFFKDYLSANDLNFIVNFACSKQNINLIECLVNNFGNQLNDYQKTRLNSVLVFSALNN